MSKSLRSIAFLTAIVALTSCGGLSDVPRPNTSAQAALPPGILIDQVGRLEASDVRVGNAYSDQYVIPIFQGDRIVVGVSASAFDPVLEVSPPSGGVLVNDDFEGSRQRSVIDFVAQAHGVMKVRVTSYSPQARGDYRVQVVRAATATPGVPVAQIVPPQQGAQAQGASNTAATAGHLGSALEPARNSATAQWQVLTPGQHIDGSLQQGDAIATDGSFADLVQVSSPSDQPLRLDVHGTDGQVLRVIVIDPNNRPVIGTPQGAFTLPSRGGYRVQVIGPAAGRTARYAMSLSAASDGQNAVAATPPAQQQAAHHAVPQGGPTAAVQLGQQVRGALAANDSHLPTGELADVYTFDARAGTAVSVEMTSTAIDSYVVVVAPDGQQWSNDDSGGTRNAALQLDLPHDGTYRVIATSYRPGETGAYELKVQPGVRATSGGAVASLTPTNGNTGNAGAQQAAATQEQSGALAQGDTTLRSGEFVDQYTYNFVAGQTVRLRLSSSAFDPYLIVRSPTGDQQDNDDLSPEDRNSGLDYAVRQTGPYTVMVTSYRAGESGAYTLSVAGAASGATVATPATNPATNPGTQPTSPQPATAGWQTQQGALAQGDSTLQSGELYDSYSFTWQPGQSVHLEARSTAFDTYLIVRSPSGHTEQNDDRSPQDRNAALDLVTSEPGQYTVVVTSYRPGESGGYELVVGAPGAGSIAPTPNNPTPNNPAPNTPSQGGNTIRGTLARGDQTLQSGEFSDHQTMRFTPGATVAIRLASTAFDPYLVVRTPSGRQLDNDDFTPGVRDSGIDIPLAESGDYDVMVTSYRPGETGAYTLTASEGTATIPRPDSGNGGGGNGASTGGHIYGVFAGISDYPGSSNDLPECANDARKLAETLRNQGLLDASHQIVLTDAQATRDGIRQAMRQMAQQVGPGDVFVFFYSGHGGQHPGSTDAREIDGIDETIVLYDGEIVDDEMGQLFNGIRGNVDLIALDSCFSGGFAKDVITAPRRIGMFSSEEDVTSNVAEQFQAGGYLSHFLRVAMQGDADGDPRDRVLTVGELTHYVWRQFGSQAADVRMSMGYQQLVVDRGAVAANTVLWAYR